MLPRIDRITHRYDGRPPRDRLLDSVNKRAALPSYVSTESALTAAMWALLEQLTAERARQLVDAMPPTIRMYFDAPLRRRATLEPGGLSRAELIERVAAQLGLTTTQAETACKAVFSGLRIELPAKIMLSVAHELPRDLQLIWLAMPPPVRGKQALQRHHTH